MGVTSWKLVKLTIKTGLSALILWQAGPKFPSSVTRAWRVGDAPSNVGMGRAGGPRAVARTREAAAAAAGEPAAGCSQPTSSPASHEACPLLPRHHLEKREVSSHGDHHCRTQQEQAALASCQRSAIQTKKKKHRPWLSWWCADTDEEWWWLLAGWLCLLASCLLWIGSWERRALVLSAGHVAGEPEDQSHNHSYCCC